MTRNAALLFARIAISVLTLLVLAACAIDKAKKPAGTTAAPRITSIPSSFDAKQLPGMDGDNLARLLGSPGLLRNEGIAQVWQYVDEACILDLFLYQNGARHIVEYVEARSSRENTAAPPSVQSCLDDILSDRRPLTS